MVVSEKVLKALLDSAHPQTPSPPLSLRVVAAAVDNAGFFVSSRDDA